MLPRIHCRSPHPYISTVLDALEYAAYAHDVRHVVLDNLQFMMSSGECGWGAVARRGSTTSDE